jgi:hypothetical protein
MLGLLDEWASQTLDAKNPFWNGVRFSKVQFLDPLYYFPGSVTEKKFN